MAQLGAVLAAAAAGAAGLLWVELQQQQHGQQQEEKEKASPLAADNTSSVSQATKRARRAKQQQRHSSLQQQLAATCPAAAEIPEDELQALQLFLRKVYRWRSWQAGSYHIVQAWNEVEEAAAHARFGSWQQQFDLKQLHDSSCNALLQLIDKQFFGGKLLRQLVCKQPAAGSSSSSSSSSSTDPHRSHPHPSNESTDFNVNTGQQEATNHHHQHQHQHQQQQHHQHLHHQQQQQQQQREDEHGQQVVTGGRIHCRVVNNFGPHGTWLAYFDEEDNAIRINHWRWNKQISPDRPVNCEGVMCTSRLQVLLHTLAHELVHAVVFHLFPEMDRSSAAYLARDRHGPIFQLLNKQLFGHSSDALELACWAAAAPARGRC